ncbi:MAG: transposase [Syntrophaceae bacterium]
MYPVEVITSVKRRRRWSAAEKKAMVQEADQQGLSIAAAARKYGIHPNQIFRWRKLVHEGVLSAVRAEEGVVPVSEVNELKKQLRDLEYLLGRKTMEMEILKSALHLFMREKTPP